MIGQHDGYEARVGTDEVFLNAHDSGAAYRQLGMGKAVADQLLERSGNAGMFQGAANKMAGDGAGKAEAGDGQRQHDDGAGPDLRNYRVDFSKLVETFPQLNLSWSVRDGIEELVGAYAKYGLTYDDFLSSRFVRLRRIRELLSAGLVDEMLRRQTVEH